MATKKKQLLALNPNQCCICLRSDLPVIRIEIGQGQHRYFCKYDADCVVYQTTRKHRKPKMLEAPLFGEI